MIKSLKFWAVFFEIFLIYGCDNHSNNNKKQVIEAGVQVIDQNFDSNFTLENIAELKTYQAFLNKFGEVNLKKDTTIAGPEGSTIDVSVLFPHTAEEVIIYWKDKHIYSLLDAVVIRCDSAGYNGKWHSKTGVQPGQLLEKVALLNQKPFTISGYGWDYGGHIVSWEGGKLDNKKITGKFADFGKNKISNEEYKSISGDTEYNINLEVIKKLNPVLEELTVFAR